MGLHDVLFCVSVLAFALGAGLILALSLLEKLVAVFSSNVERSDT